LVRKMELVLEFLLPLLPLLPCCSRTVLILDKSC
jgi:hypothetical protein